MKHIPLFLFSFLLCRTAHAEPVATPDGLTAAQRPNPTLALAYLVGEKRQGGPQIHAA